MKVLFDNSFSEFITRRVTKALYVVYLAILSVYIGFAMIFGVTLLTQGEILLGIGVVVAAPLTGLLLLILGRLAFEFGIALVIVAENSQKLVDSSRKS